MQAQIDYFKLEVHYHDLIMSLIELDYQYNIDISSQYFTIHAIDNDSLAIIKTILDHCVIFSVDELLSIVNHLSVIINLDIISQLNEIIHHDEFKAMEARWRGVELLINTYIDCQEDRLIKIKLLNIKWQELNRDLSFALDFDQSLIFQHIYSNEFDMPGGEPFGVVMIDHAISHKYKKNKSGEQDLEAIKKLSEIGAAALCPFFFGVSPELFGVDDITDLGHSNDIKSIFNQDEYVLWKKLREQDTSRFIGLVMPEILMRKPYCNDGLQLKDLSFTEQVHDLDDYLWGNAAFAFISVLMRAFASTAWFADIRGANHEIGDGGNVRGLTYANFTTDISNMSLKPATKIVVDPYLEKQLSQLGFIPLCSESASQIATFYSNQSIFLPNKTTFNDDNGGYLSAMLQYLLCACRFGQYLKVIGRDKVGRFDCAVDCQRVFQNWLNQYTVANDTSIAIKARYPLAESLVQVFEKQGRPGLYTCVIYLRPHFQLDNIIANIKLVTDLTLGNNTAANHESYL